MTSGGKQPRKGVPNEQHSDIRKSDDTKNDRKDPVGPVKTHEHRPLLTAARKETVRA